MAPGAPGRGPLVPRHGRQQPGIVVQEQLERHDGSRGIQDHVAAQLRPRRRDDVAEQPEVAAIGLQVQDVRAGERAVLAVDPDGHIHGVGVEIAHADAVEVHQRPVAHRTVRHVAENGLPRGSGLQGQAGFEGRQGVQAVAEDHVAEEPGAIGRDLHVAGHVGRRVAGSGRLNACQAGTMSCCPAVSV